MNVGNRAGCASAHPVEQRLRPALQFKPGILLGLVAGKPRDALHEVKDRFRRAALFHQHLLDDLARLRLGETALAQEDLAVLVIAIRVVIGDYRGIRSPVDGIAADPQYLDIFVPAGRRKTFKVDTYRRAFAYVFEGAGRFADAGHPEGVLLEKEVAGQEVNIRDLSGNRTLVRFGSGDTVTVQAGPEGVRFLLVSGAPIEEPVAWAGPIVMNTEDELRQAFAELRNGTFIKAAH